MPTYEYECEACGHRFDEFQYMSDKPLKKCPKCTKLKLHRLIGSGAGIIFKGSGFYETDYKRKEQPKPAAEKSEKKPAADAAPAPAASPAPAPATPPAKAS
ncbi:MAG: zinc ribbon domain-containing protein [Planctomycetes bacterium]|nr:zinc ribbon domain-containing protein [Planctomycetota bacterium]